MNEDVARIPLLSRYGEIVGYTLVDSADAAFVNQWVWRLLPGNRTDYARRAETIDGVFTNILLHREIAGLPRVGRDPQVDHENHDGLDNRKENLRIGPPRHNAQNLPLRLDNSSGYRGVTLHKRSGKWRAEVRLDWELHYLGLFSTPEEANMIVTSWRREHMPFSTD